MIISLLGIIRGFKVKKRENNPPSKFFRMCHHFYSKLLKKPCGIGCPYLLPKAIPHIKDFFYLYISFFSNSLKNMVCLTASPSYA